jgi:hypothetical protein
MEVITTLRNLYVQPQNDAELQALRADQWSHYQPATPIRRTIQGQPFDFRPGLTLTPFANPVPCNAHCRFCSEELQRRDGHQLTAKRLILDYDRYFAGLEAALAALAGLPMGLSLSGLEATAEPEWLRRLLATLAATAGIAPFDEKVLYTNGSGIYRHAWMADALDAARFDRIELSRCHYDEAVNQRVMYFNRNEPVWQNGPYEALVERMLAHNQFQVKNSCILTRPGVHDLAEMERYLDWVLDLGVRAVVFRELSRLDDTYLPNATARWVEANRVPIEPILQALSPSMSGTRAGWAYAGSTVGYYYYNEHFRYRDAVEVIVETSSYPALMAANATSIIQKLVYHSNGQLCGDWDPDTFVIGRFA